MPVRIQCQCGKVLSVKDEFAGKAVKCPGCGKAVRVPAAKAAQGAGAAQSGGASGPASSSAKPAAAKSQAAKTGTPRAKPGAGRGGQTTPAVDDLDDLFAEEGFNRSVGAVCPACAAEMNAGAVLCTKCGFNKETGQRLDGHKLAGVDVDHGTLALNKARADIEKDKQLQIQMLGKAGMPWWMLGLVLFMLASGTSIAVLAVNASRRVDEEITFNPLNLFLTLAGSGFFLVSQCASLLLIIKAFKSSLKDGLLSLFVPFYILYFCIKHWSATWKLLFTAILTGMIAAGFYFAIVFYAAAEAATGT